MEIKQGTLDAERRAFLKKTGTLAVMSTLGLSFFTACSDDDEPSPANLPGTGSGTGIDVTGNTITIDTNLQTILKSAGGWILITSAQTLVVNDGGTIRALTSICTHSGCDRSWSFGSGVFTCTCHGSRFNTNGSVITGPAAAPLRAFTVSSSGTIITITK